MENLFYLTIGDFFGDGYGVCESYLVRSTKRVEDVREAHFKIKDATGIDLEEICSGYKEDSIDQETIGKIEALGFELEDNSGIGKEILNVDKMANLWVFLLQQADPELKLEFVREHEEIPTLLFTGKDKQGRHIKNVGYGLIF